MRALEIHLVWLGLLTAVLGCAEEVAPVAMSPAQETEAARGDALVLVSDACAVQHAHDRFMQFQAEPAPEWHEGAKQVHQELVDSVHAELDVALQLKAVAQEVADGDISNAALAQLEELRAASIAAKESVEANDKRLRQELADHAAAKKKLEDAERTRRAKEWDQECLERGWNKGITMAGYLALNDGMSRYEVCMILDSFSYEEQSSAGPLATYAWQDGFKTIIVTFRNDALIAKGQVGL